MGSPMWSTHNPRRARKYALNHATNVLSERRKGRHSTLLNMVELEELADKYKATLIIVSTHSYRHYDSIVYDIDCLQNEISDI